MNEGAFRGMLLVGVAVVIGIVLLSSGLDDTAPVTARGDDGDGEAASQDSDPATTEEVPATGDLSPSDIPLVVANGSGVEGAAAAVTEQLTGLGYLPGAPVDVSPDAGETLLDTVYFLTQPSSFQAHGERVAADLNLPAEAVIEMPNPPPADIGLAPILVVLGSQPGGLAEQATGAATATTAPPG